MQFVAYDKTFAQMTKSPLAELLGWAAIATAGLAMLLSALWLWTFLRE
jgi:hypothetical protein